MRRSVPTREEILTTEMRRLVARVGLDACFEALSRVRDEGSPRPRSAEFAASYDALFVTDTAAAELWFIPAPDGAGIFGQACWIPKSMIIEASSPAPSVAALLEGEMRLGFIRTVEPVQWWRGRKHGNRIEKVKAIVRSAE